MPRSPIRNISLTLLENPIASFFTPPPLRWILYTFTSIHFSLVNMWYGEIVCLMWPSTRWGDFREVLYGNGFEYWYRWYLREKEWPRKGELLSGVKLCYFELHWLWYMACYLIVIYEFSDLLFSYLCISRFVIITSTGIPLRCYIWR